jgi:hypothetical protein
MVLPPSLSVAAIINSRVAAWSSASGSAPSEQATSMSESLRSRKGIEIEIAHLTSASWG